MIFETIPQTPIPLTPDQSEQLSQSHIKKHQVAIVLLHWFNAFVWLIELVTGSALIVAPAYRFAPEWYLVMMEQIFGARENLLRCHIAVGMAWMAVFIIYAVFGWKHYLHAEVLKKEVGLDQDDFDWLRIRILNLLGMSREKLPPQGAYNAGQKLYAFLIYSAIPVIILTGLIMVFHVGGASMVAWAMLIHFVSVGMVVSGLLVHVYMGAVFPEERPAFYSMITGTVDELYAYKHHFKWWKEMKTEQILRRKSEEQRASNKESKGCAALSAKL